MTQPAPATPGSDVVATLIPYKNPSALGAYYCGVFALIPGLGLILGPLGLILGIRGIGFAKTNPAAKGKGHAIAGVVLGSITTALNYAVLVWFLVVILMARH